MRIGIVGSEAAKFTSETEALARQAIRRLLVGLDYRDLVVSGKCHLGGIDIWAIEEARKAGIPTQEYPPASLRWEGGYKQRNLQIAHGSDLVACITVKTLPPGYSGMRFDRGCYHCGTPPEHHVKSGGCWTMKQAARAGKQIELVVVEPTRVPALADQE